MKKLPSGICGAAAMLLLPLLALAQTGPGPTPAKSAKPAVLIATCLHSCQVDVAKKLVGAGFSLNLINGLEDRPLTWDEARKYNVIVVSGLGRANADMSLPANVKQSIETLRRFLDAGGGVLLMPYYGQMMTDAPAQDEFLKPLGLNPLFDEYPLDPETAVAGTPWDIPFAYTNSIAESPVAGKITGLWYPIPDRRIGGQNHSFALQTDETWTVIIKGGKTSMTKKGALQQNPTEPGSYQSNVPLAAIKQAGKGRLMVVGITPEYLFGKYAETTLAGIVLDRGLHGIGSGGYQLIENGLKWLAEPSLGDASLGGAPPDPKVLADPFKTQFVQPYDWSRKVEAPLETPASAGIIGARTTYSTGKATPDQWVAKAKAKNLTYLVFLEEFSKLSRENFDKLKADCARLSSPDFAAIPGFTIDDEIGNHYFYFGTTFMYPPKDFLSEDGTVFRSRDMEMNPKDHYIKGQLSMTTLDYAYSLSSFKLTAGHYLYQQNAEPFANFFSNWDAMAVITSRNGRVIEDETRDYLAIAASGQGPTPLVLDLMDDPSGLDATPWHTLLRLPGAGASGERVRDYFNTWHFYPDNPSRISITSGPEIQWSYTGPRDYEGGSRGDFVWQNYRWILNGKVRSAAGLANIEVYDGTQLFRHYLPAGKNEFDFTLDLTHDRQHNLVVIATDAAGKRAISGEQWDRNHRLEEFQCADRNNQLSYGYSTTKEGNGIMIGGNQPLATPIKRVSTGSGNSPAGTFKCDQLLGAPAFDGGASGDPDILDNVRALGTAAQLPAPVVVEPRRLLHTGDVNIGEGKRENAFTDNITVGNVWHTLWRTQPTSYSVTRRNTFFQINPDSPLAVFLWDIDIRLREDMPNTGFQIGLLRPGKSQLWALRSADSVKAGSWEDTPESATRTYEGRFDSGGYAAFLDSPLGGSAVFSLSKDLRYRFNLPRRDSLSLFVSGTDAPQRKGESVHVAMLLLGIPRLTESTRNLPGASTEVVERFRRDFGLDGGEPGYTVKAMAGKVRSRRYILDIDGQMTYAFSGQLEGNLISSLPITVSNSNRNWSAFLYDRGLKKARPIGVFDSKAWATIPLNGSADIFVGHPVTADKSGVILQLTQTGESTWRLEVHNPSDKAVETTLKPNALFDPLQGRQFPTQPVKIAAGSSLIIDL